MKWMLMFVCTCMYPASGVVCQTVTQSEEVTPTTNTVVTVETISTDITVETISTVFTVETTSPVVTVETISSVVTLETIAGEPFSLWCNFTTSIDLSTVSFQIKWIKDDKPWCIFVSAKVNKTAEECVGRGITLDDVYNPSGTQNFQLNIPTANVSDSGNYTCVMVILGEGNDIIPSTRTIVLVKDQATSPAIISSTSIKVSTINENTIPPRPVTSTTPLSTVSSSKAPASNKFSKETIIAIGAGAGGGVLLITIIIVAVTCVKKNSKGNSTSDIDQIKATYRKSYPMEENAENVDDRRKSNPLDKNVENLHYADLTLHDPKSSRSKGTGSAKSKTLTVNPSDERVEYAAVMAS